MKFLLFTTLLFAACAPVTSSPGIHFTAERVSSDTVRLALDNGTQSQIGYNLCTSALERRSGSDWIPVQTDDVCTMELRTLNPGADATFEKKLPATLPAGEYRYSTRVESPLGSAGTTVTTNTFTR